MVISWLMERVGCLDGLGERTDSSGERVCGWMCGADGGGMNWEDDGWLSERFG